VPIETVKTTVLVALNWLEVEEGLDTTGPVAVNIPGEAALLGEDVAVGLAGDGEPGTAGTKDRFPEVAALEDCCITIELGPRPVEEFVVGEERASEDAEVPVESIIGEVEGAVPEAAALEDCMTGELSTAGPEAADDTEDTVGTEEAAGKTEVEFAKLENPFPGALEATTGSLAGNAPVTRIMGAPEEVVNIASVKVLPFAAADDEELISKLKLADGRTTGAVVNITMLLAEELAVATTALVDDPEDVAPTMELRLADEGAIGAVPVARMIGEVKVKLPEATPLLLAVKDDESAAVELEMGTITTPLEEPTITGDGLANTAPVDSNVGSTVDEPDDAITLLLAAGVVKIMIGELDEPTITTLLSELELAVTFAKGGTTIEALWSELAGTAVSLPAVVENGGTAAALDAGADPTLIRELELNDETITGPGAVGKTTSVLDGSLVRDTALLLTEAEDGDTTGELNAGTFCGLLLDMLESEDGTTTVTGMVVMAAVELEVELAEPTSLPFAEANGGSRTVEPDTAPGWMLVVEADEGTTTVTGTVVFANGELGDELAAEIPLLATAGSEKGTAVKD